MSRVDDHTKCPTEAHDFTYEDTGLHPDEDQAHVGRWAVCNDCLAPLFYCTISNTYHHAAGNFYQDCFLADGFSVAVPELNDDELVEMLLNSIRVAQNRGYLRIDAQRIYDIDENWLAEFFAIFLPASAEGNTENAHIIAIGEQADARFPVHPAAR